MEKIYLTLLLLFAFGEMKAQGVIIYGVSDNPLDTAINTRYRKFVMHTKDSALKVYVVNSSGTGAGSDVNITNDSIKVWFQKALNVILDSSSQRVIQNMIVNAKQSGTWTITTSQDTTGGINVKQRTTDSMRVNGKVSISGSVPITGSITTTTDTTAGMIIKQRATDSLKTTIYGKVKPDTIGASTVSVRGPVPVTTDSVNLKTNSTRYIGIVGLDSNSQRKTLMITTGTADTLKTKPFSDTSKSAIGVKVENKLQVDSTSTGTNYTNRLLETNLGYNDADSLFCDTINTTKTLLTADSTNKSTKKLYISFISISTDSAVNVGYQIFAMNGPANSTKVLFQTRRLTTNAQVVMNLVNSPIVLPYGTLLWGKKVIPTGITEPAKSCIDVTVIYRWK